VEGHVNRREKTISVAVNIAVATAVLLSGPVAWAADSREVEDLRSEVRQLQAQVQAMRTAMVELSEVERRSAALSVGPNTPEPAPLPPTADAGTEARESSTVRASSTGADRPARSSKHRRHRSSSRSRSKASRGSASDR
jgi:hypothetical protein